MDTDSDLIGITARELREQHRLTNQVPRAVAAWRNIDAVPAWLKRARTSCAKPEPETAKAAEWLLDNDYQVLRAVREIREDLPTTFYRKLPPLAGSENQGLPRAFCLAHGLLRACRMQVSLAAAVRFVRAYQEEMPLTIAELWAFPTMLRLACLEALLAGFARLIPNLKPPFTLASYVEMLGPLDDTECVSRALGNLGVIASISWKDFFDRTSQVEAILQGDPANVYARMHFDTRDLYRKAVEELAFYSTATHTETDVAERVVALARAAGARQQSNHVGDWLIGRRRDEAEAALGYHSPLGAAARRWLLRRPGGFYASALVGTGVAALLPPALYLAVMHAQPWAWTVGIMLTLLPASIVSVAAAQWLVTLIVPPRVLPKLDFDKHIPPEYATAVVMPVIVGTATEVPALIERMELHWLANPDPALQFVLLSDHMDAPTASMPQDGAVEQALVRGIRLLNGRYGQGRDGPFHLLHRPRLFNSAESCWMGWERKRGKLEQFNRLVLEDRTATFSLQEGNTDALHGLRFVVTVDADTTLPPGSVNRLVGALAHPLNTAVVDPATGRVRSGYTVIQPRVEIRPEHSNRTLFAWLAVGNTAIDIYSRAVSDVYQDLFGVGSYIGKGIYEIAPFQKSLEARVPENTLLSHDLLEGAHGRVALASDIVVYEGFPAGYQEYSHRWHRWVRGDWQLLPWLGRNVLDVHGQWARNRLPALERWKILDNLRRSLTPLALAALAAAGWLFLPGSAWVWTLFTVIPLGIGLIAETLGDLFRGLPRGTMRGTLHQLREHIGRWLLSIVFLIQDAVIALDAIARTLWRLLVSRRHLLEWTSAAHSAARFSVAQTRAAAWRAMWVGPAVAGACMALIILANPSALPPAAPILLLWVVAPEIALWTGRPFRSRRLGLTADERAYLRRLARRTWLYFETFAGPEENWLPPDNFQEQPRAELAHRTSPTDIGMMFLSTITAWDFGYLVSSDFEARVHAALDTLDRLERYRGHFFNWYDTRLLHPLEPRYVSTVDSGNLALCLVTLKESCLEAADAPCPCIALWDGLADTLNLLVDAVERALQAEIADLRATVTEIAECAATVRTDPGNWRIALVEIRQRRCPKLEMAITNAIARPQLALSAESLREVRAWLERVHHHLTSMQRDLDSLYPWLTLTDTAPPSCADLVRRIKGDFFPAVRLAEAGDACARVRKTVAAASETAVDQAAERWLSELDASLAQSALAQGALRMGLRTAAERAGVMAEAMQFGLLYDHESELFHIGHNASSDTIDPHHYDLLASEARLASYFAIAKRDIPPNHWFFLGRPITRLPKGMSLVSWNGSMFEYLMPSLLLRSGPDTLMTHSEWAAVDAQRRYAKRLDIPWGVSESSYAVLDVDDHYQYQAFGVPGLGLRRGLARDRVISPYATALALAVSPGAAVRNLRELEDLGLSGAYGVFEAVDFTPDRLPVGHSFVVVRSYMAHHQGMILAAIGNASRDDVLVTRLRRDPRMRSIELLLEERIPWEFALEPVRQEEQYEPIQKRGAIPTLYPWAPSAANDFPQMYVLGNGRMATWISEAGAGALWWRRQALTRWLPDATRDNYGLWIYVRDECSGEIWSVGRQPCGIASEDEHVVFHAHLAEFHRRDHGIAISMAVGILPGDDVEIRRVTVTNDSDRPRVVSLSSYGEVVLAPPLDDERHPAFSKIFVGGERVTHLNGLLFTRRPRSSYEAPPVLLHRVVFDDPRMQIAGFETDRRSFLGRNGDPQRPRGIVENLSGTVGWTLDPIMSLQVRLELEPQERRQLAFLTMVSGSRGSVLELAERYAELSSLDWALVDAAAEAAREAQRLGLEPEWLREVATLASLLIHPHKALRAAPPEIAANRLGQPRLWSMGISGDLPLLLVRASEQKESGLLKLLVRAHQLWRRRGLWIDLVILRMGVTGYEEPVRERVLALLREGGAHELLGRSGGIHLIFSDRIRDDDSHLLEAAARVVLDEARGSLTKQLERASESNPLSPRFEPTGAPAVEPDGPMLARPTGLLFANDLGGFTDDGREYVIHLEPGAHTPAPWCNVLANDGFGCIVTETGGGFTWAANSGENRLTAWTNDPVADSPSEAVYLRDEETAEVWTPTPAPAGAAAACQIRHGAGYTTWRQHSHGLEQELLIFVPTDQPVKIARLRLRNTRPRPRRITATYYAEWQLGALRSVARPHVICEYDPEIQALFARNPWNPDFAERVAFLTSSLPPHSLTTDRQDFLGREGHPGRPAGLINWDLGGRVRPGTDACAALQVHLDLSAAGTIEFVFVLGQGRDREHATELARACRQAGWPDSAFNELNTWWDQRLGAVRVHTPDTAFDLMVNRWLLYQTIASRVLARAGFYQAGGAFGFRDQLQDILALFHAEPARARAHILASAARQFEDGDVLHWWHPPNDRGVRTRCSDDLLWLPYVTSRYVEATGDSSILQEEIPFLRAAPLLADEYERYAKYDAGPESRTLFEHCQRALEHGDTRGAHGLPLMGSGDWNDGMNRVGAQGRGESVWLAWFAIATMRGFTGLAARMGRDDLVERWNQRSGEIEQAIEQTAWDGQWYARAFADDGRPWGVAACAECRIDSIAQSWAVLAGASSSEHARVAIAAAAKELVRVDEKVVRLLWPPFDETSRDPGYIKAYPRGIRENGGQYAHAAAWLGLAFVGLGDGDHAWQIFDLLSPIQHAAAQAEACHYRVEPYVLAADIASVAPHTGQGGWTWYTGSAAWLLRLGVEGILGLQLRNGALLIDPCLPNTWGGAEAVIQGPTGALAIHITDPEHVGRGVVEISVDGVAFAGTTVAFTTDGSVRRVTVRLGRPPSRKRH